MEFKIINNIPNIPGLNVAVSQAGTDTVAISISLDEAGARTLGSFNPGEAVKIGNREYIVLSHGANTTAVITKSFAKKMRFGDNGDWRESDVRAYCNGEFYDELVAAVGAENIVEHAVNLVSDDGTGKGTSCKDRVSILTVDLYRQYRELLPAYGDWWWLSTRVSKEDVYHRYVCYVCNHGAVSWLNCVYVIGVRPFCILNSSVFVS